MNRLMVLLAFTLVQVTFNASAYAEEYSSYDDIIRDLKGSTTTSLPTQNARGPGLDAVKIHAGIAMVSSRLNLNLPQGVPGSKGLRGVELAFGIDLFTPEWIAEGTLRNFGKEKFATTDVSLKEFDLKLVHKRMFSDKIFGRFGGGMAARYLDFDQAPAAGTSNSYTTPSSVILVGVGSHITSGMALSAEATYRSALINDTADESAVDGSVRLTGSF